MNIVDIWPNMQIDHFATQKNQSEKASLVTMISLPFFVTISLFLLREMCVVYHKGMFYFSFLVYICCWKAMSPFVVCVAIGKLVLKKEVEKTTMEKGFELCKSTEKKEKCDCESCNLCRIFSSATFCLLTSSTVSQFSLFAYGPWP